MTETTITWGSLLIMAAIWFWIIRDLRREYWR